MTGEPDRSPSLNPLAGSLGAGLPFAVGEEFGDTSMLDLIIHITQVNKKYWQEFSATSPGGIEFAGYLCRQESEKLGMLAVTRLDGTERLEFIYAMPKIPYPYVRDRKGEARLVIPLPQNAVEARFNVKLDGTCIIYYPLTDPQGNVLEVVPRTRLQPVLTRSRWGDWEALVKEAMPDQRPIHRAVRDQKTVLCFELWGYRNPHLVSYDTPLALTLHSGVRNKRLVSHRLLADIARRYGLSLIESIAAVSLDEAGLARAYRELQERMEARNRSAGENVYVEEGAILVLSTPETATYYKCLDGRSLVLTKQGWKSISSIVSRRQEIEVATVERNGRYGWHKITGWHRNLIGGRRMMRVGLKHARRCSNGFKGVNVTTDHLFLTKSGYKMAGALTTQDWIVTGEIAPNPKQMELIDGMLLGDASIPRSGSRIRFAHADHEYARLKEKALGSLVSSSRVQIRRGKYAYNLGSRDTYEVDLKALIWTRQQKERWYPHGKKRVPRDLVLSDLTLAVWYLDDGGLSDKHAVFATNAFEKDDVEWLSGLLRARGLENKVTAQNTICLSNAATEILMTWIGPYIPPCMRRKVLENAAEFNEELWDLGDPIPGYDTPVFGPPTTPTYERSVYCIDVDQTGNFVTSAGVVHNCKPPSIEEVHWAVGRTISKEIVRQALFKMTENGYDFEAGRVEDLMAELEKDFQRPHVEGQEDLIRRVWVEYIVELQRKEWLRHLVEASGIDPRETVQLMRHLSQRYPKKEMRWVYNTVRALYGLEK
ncbi:MAG: hypothetical protein ACE5MB_03005 [Anaerolineae bacterium]